MEYDYSQLGLSIDELFSHQDHSELESEKIIAPRYSYWRSVMRVFFKKKLNIFMLVVLVAVVAFAYIYPSVTEFDKYGNLLNSDAKHLRPSAAIARYGMSIKYILGTGASGQATFDAIWNGAKISLSLAFLCAAINMTIGVVLGAVWGFSKKVDAVMLEVSNILGNIPYILLISVLMMLFNPGFWTMVFALTVVGWLGPAAFIRTQVVIIRDREYNLASKCLGTSTFKIAMKNILPFMVSVIMTYLAAEVPSYISYEVFLAYIGRGMSEMSLGRLISDAQPAMVTPGWQLEFWSPVAITAVISIVLYVVGLNLGDASDPRTHM